MPSTKAIKQRMRSVKNTSQITKAMEVVSATKMRKSQEFAIRARPYAAASLELLKNLLARTSERPPLLQSRPISNSLLLVITSDKGLAGAFNANVLRKADDWVARHQLLKSDFNIITVGKKARDYYQRRGSFYHPNFLDKKTAVQNASLKSWEGKKSFWGFGDFTTLSQTLPVADEIIKGFLENRWDEVETVYTHFRTTLRQETSLKRILPVTQEGITKIVAGILPEHGRFAESGIKKQESRYSYEYLLEPSPADILGTLVPQLIRMHVHHIILESNASEHSSRMVAMKSASDNAKELIEGLTLEYNKSRQAGITRELTEITAGKEALEN